MSPAVRGTCPALRSGGPSRRVRGQLAMDGDTRHDKTDLGDPGDEDLESLLDGFLMFGQTTTAIVVATAVPPRSPSLPDARVNQGDRSDATIDNARSRGSGPPDRVQRP